MRVQVDDALSESIKVKKRVPRGSFLGLFLFVLLIDDLSNDIVSFSSYLFTDDLFFTVSTHYLCFPICTVQ